jgi:hypothetical protein
MNVTVARVAKREGLIIIPMVLRLVAELDSKL